MCPSRLSPLPIDEDGAVHWLEVIQLRRNRTLTVRHSASPSQRVSSLPFARPSAPVIAYGRLLHPPHGPQALPTALTVSIFHPQDLPTAFSLLQMFCHASERQEPSSHLQTSRHPKRKVRFPPPRATAFFFSCSTASTCCTILQLHSTASFDTSTSRAIVSACIMLLLGRLISMSSSRDFVCLHVQPEVVDPFRLPRSYAAGHSVVRNDGQLSLAWRSQCTTCVGRPRIPASMADASR